MAEESVYNQLLKTNPKAAEELMSTWDEALAFITEMEDEK